VRWCWDQVSIVCVCVCVCTRGFTCSGNGRRRRRRRRRRLLTTAFFWAITQRVVLIRYRAHLQGSRRTFWPLEMGPISCLETSVINYNHKLRSTSEECRSNLFRRGNMKSRKKTLFTSKLDWNLGNKLVKYYILSIDFGYGANIWTSENRSEIPGSLEMWCWWRMDKTSWTDRVKTDEVLHRIKENKNILHKTERRKANWIGHVFRRNCLLKHVVGGKIKVGRQATGRWGRRCKLYILWTEHRDIHTWVRLTRCTLFLIIYFT